jgi:hypothetical protein
MVYIVVFSLKFGIKPVSVAVAYYAVACACYKSNLLYLWSCLSSVGIHEITNAQLFFFL